MFATLLTWPTKSFTPCSVPANKVSTMLGEPGGDALFGLYGQTPKVPAAEIILNLTPLCSSTTPFSVADTWLANCV